MSSDKWSRGNKGREFNDTSRDDKAPPRRTNDAATIEEIKRREAARPVPHKAAKLTPGNHTEQYVHERHANKNEKRIAQLRKRLVSRKHKSRDDFDRGR